MEKEIVCYCFNYNVEDIRKDLNEHGESTIMYRIIQEKKDGKCNCEHTNPSNSRFSPELVKMLCDLSDSPLFTQPPGQILT